MTKSGTTRKSQVAKPPSKVSAELLLDVQLPAAKFVVRGEVRLADGTPLAGARVLAYDKDLRSEKQLGEPTTTDRDGRYEIVYTADQLARAEKHSADLLVRVVNPSGREPTDSSIIFDAQPEETVPLVVSGEVRGPSEYERLVAMLTPLLRDVLLAQLTDDDITFLAGDTGEDRQRIAWLGQSAKLTRQTTGTDAPPTAGAIPAEAFYGWFRQGVPTEPGALWATPTETLLTTLKAAMEQRVVPPSTSANLDGIGKRIEQIKLDLVLKAPGLGTTASLGDLLATLPAPLNLDQQRAIAAALSELRPDDSQLVNRIAGLTGFDGDAIGVARTVRLAALTAGHLPMAQALQHRLADEDEGALRPLATLRPDEWLDLAYTHRTPNREAITPVAYADALAAGVEQQHPTAALAAHLTDGRRLGQQLALRDAGTFLRDNPTFDIVTANLNGLIEDAKFGRVAEPKQLVDGLRTLQRMNTLGVRWQEAAIFLENGLDSPQKLLDAGPEQLAALLDGQVTSERVAELHARAEDLYSTTFAAFTTAMSPLSGPNVLPNPTYIYGGGDPINPDLGGVDAPSPRPAPFPDDDGSGAAVDGTDWTTVLSSRGGAFDPNRYKFPPPVRTALIPDRSPQLDLGEKIAGQPTLQALFGAQDACVCGDCNSVLGPAAYFVDVLQFIRNGKPYERLLKGLLQRRPDLEDLELSCNNTNTDVPAIDLALEILENAVALPLDVLLPAGTDIREQLRMGEEVGQAVKDALKKTVRGLSGEVRAAREGDAWTVVDGHRRWKLTLQNEYGLRAERATGKTQLIDSTGLNLSALVDALDQGLVSSGAEATFAQLFMPNYLTAPDFTNYSVTVTPQVPGQSWRVKYRSVAQLLVNARANQLVLQTRVGETWFENEYNKRTIADVRSDLERRTVPALVQELLAQRFLDTSKPTLRTGDTSWVFESPERELTLRFIPKGSTRLTITSLAYQSGDAGADAVAEPENHNPEAYARLKGDLAAAIPIPAFPWSLPVDLPLEEVRLFLDRARSKRRRWIELTLPFGQVPDDDVVFANEVLGLSSAEATLIALPLSPDPAVYARDVYANWGLLSTATSISDAAAGQMVKGATALDLLKNVSILLQQSRLSFEELQAVIATEFVSKGGTAPLRIEPLGTCVLGEMKLSALTAPHLDRIHRFVRLQRRTEWSALDLDTAITLATGADINVATLRGLAHLARLCELLNLPIATVLALLKGSVSIEDRTHALARALSLSVGELQHACVLFDISSANVLASPGAALGFCERVKVFSRGGIAFEDLRYLLRHHETPTSNVGLDEKQLARLVGAAHAAVRSIPDAPEKQPPFAAADPEILAVRRNQEDATIAALATGLGAARELVDDLLRIRLRHPSDPREPAIGVFLTSPLFSPRDFKDLELLIRKLRVHVDRVSQYVWNELSAGDQAVLSDTSSTAEVLQDTLIAALNELVQGPSLYDQPSFSDVGLSVETLALKSQDPTGAELARLNRQLLEDAFAKDLWSTSAAIGAVLVRLHKTVFLCEALKLSATDLRLLQEPTTEANGLTALDFNALPGTSADAPADVAGFEQLMALVHLRDIAPRANDLLHQYASLDGADIAYPQNARKVLAMGLLGGLEVKEISEVNDAAKLVGITAANQYRDPVALTRLIELLGALQQLGATVEQAVRLVAASPDDSAALTARALLQSKFSDSSWHDLIKPIADTLRTRQRDALVDFLVAQDQLRDSPNETHRLRGADDLYERYLIDVQTGSCLETTRLLQATAAAQLFVQRVLLNLEVGLSLTDDKRQLWDWMDRYRVWEANRKVFLFPENWLLPELRDDKTATFRQMESALTEQEPSLEITRAALLGYVEELGDLAQISVIAMYQDQSTLYVVGRTPDQPYRYFARSCEKFGSAEMSWSGWEALDLDNANDFISPFVFEGDLHIVWPIFRKTTKEDELLLWEVQIAWTRRTNQGWTKRKISQGQLDVKRLLNKDASASFAFRIDRVDSPMDFANNGKPLTRETINIDCYAANEAIRTMRPDPSLLKDAAPIGTHKTSNQWNVSCAVSGVVYEYATVNEDGNVFSRPLEGAAVELTYERRFSSGDPFGGDIRERREPSPPKVTTTGKDGTFTIKIPTPASNNTEKNGGEGVLNGSAITLTVIVPSAPVPIEINLTRTLGNDVVGLFKDWSWHVNVGVENTKIKESFLPGRRVEYRKAGTFVLESGKDVRSDDQTTSEPLPEPIPSLGSGNGSPMSVDGNRFSTKTINTWIDNINFGAEGPLSLSTVTPVIEAPVFITRASQPSGPPDLAGPHAWYLQDNDGGSYLRKWEDVWHRWPDGQPYASSYRVAATLSTSVLFQPKFENHLHFDPIGNTFARQIPYANYNWELFLHAPLAIADYLASQQRFADARLWLHAVFDPTRPQTQEVSQFWRFSPFRDATQPDAIAKVLTWLADPNSNPGDSAAEKKRKEDIETDLKSQIDQWKQNPFMPHLIARLRPSAYRWHTFFAYLDVLIGWGDQLFRRDTRESVNEATLLYVLAAKLLGPRPRVTPAPTPPPPQTYRSLRANTFDDFGNTWVTYADLPGMKKMSSSRRAATTGRIALARPSNTPRTALTSLMSINSMAFCIPQNEKVTEFYGRIEDRLSNVRNCRNIDGVFRQLPKFEPRIDPLLLIRARAAGLDLDSVIAGLYAPLPHYRFSFTLQKALELTAELKALGGALLAALEKQDAEELTLLRSSHEIAMLRLVSDTRKHQTAEAEANIAALQQSEVTIRERFGQYQKLLGKTGISNGQDGLPVVEQSSSLSVSTDPVGGASGLGLSRKEVDQLVLAAVAHHFTQAANSGHVMAGVLSLVPNFTVGSPFASSSFGGSFLGSAATATAKAIEMGAAEANYFANLMGTFGVYERRQDEWVHQSKLAVAELKQINKQILAAEIRKEIAELELRNHETQIENAENVDEFMRGKFTSKQLHRWTSSKIAEVYFRSYQLALDQAKRAERAYLHELGVDAGTTPFVRAGYWDSLKKGLLAGEQLHHDLKRMESAYLEQNRREYEISKHVSVSQVDPIALILLKQTGKCALSLPEALFDLDYPGHYLRRLKSVGITIPCIAGPYASVSCTVTLKKSAIRHQKDPGTNYPGDPYDADNGRFRSVTVPTQSIVTSTAQNDSGLFEASLRDERYLPFEGAGAISEWELELAKDFPAFDFGTIADVIFHLRYTARDAGGTLKSAATGALKSTLNLFKDAEGITGLARVFSLRHEFSSEWQRFLNPTAGTTGDSTMVLHLTQDRFPYLVQGSTLAFKSFEFLASMKSQFAAAHPQATIKLSWKAETAASSQALTLTPWGAAQGKLLRGDIEMVAPGAPGSWTLAAWMQRTPGGSDSRLDPDAVEDVLLVCRYVLPEST